MRQRLAVDLEDSTAPYNPRNFKLDGAVPLLQPCRHRRLSSTNHRVHASRQKGAGPMVSYNLVTQFRC